MMKRAKGATLVEIMEATGWQKHTVRGEPTREAFGTARRRNMERWSLDSPDSGRGRTYAAVVLDEAALIPNLENAWQESIRPQLTDFQGRAWFLSTPKGVAN